MCIRDSNISIPTYINMNSSGDITLTMADDDGTKNATLNIGLFGDRWNHVVISATTSEPVLGIDTSHPTDQVTISISASVSVTCNGQTIALSTTVTEGPFLYVNNINPRVWRTIFEGPVFFRQADCAVAAMNQLITNDVSNVDPEDIQLGVDRNYDSYTPPAYCNAAFPGDEI